MCEGWKYNDEQKFLTLLVLMYSRERGLENKHRGPSVKPKKCGAGEGVLYEPSQRCQRWRAVVEGIPLNGS